MSIEEAPLSPTRTWPDYRAVWRWHFYAGLFCIPFVIVLTLSGVLYLFKSEIEAWNDSPYDQLSVRNGPASVSAQVTAVLAAIPDATFSSYELPQTEHSAARVIVRYQGEQWRVYLDPESLRVLQRVPENQRFMRWVFKIHGELLMGDRGSMLVELAACWTIIMLLTGIYLWWPRNSKTWGGIVYPRLNAGSRLFWRDLHGVTGFWISGFALILLLSGLPWAKFWGDYFKAVRRLTGTAVAKQDWENSTGSARPARSSAAGEHGDHGSGRSRNNSPPNLKNLAEINRVAATAKSLQLDPPVLISPPSGGSYNWVVKSNTANRPRRVNVVINGRSGEIVSRDGFADRHLIDQIVAVGIAAHEGRLFGWPNQLLGLLTALGLLMLCVSGIIMWWRRREPGTLGAPRSGLSPRFSVGLFMLVLLLGLYLPLFGISMLVVWLLERLILRQLPGVQDWLGLNQNRATEATP